MARKMMDCGRFPSATNCTLKISGSESEVLDEAVMHATTKHGHKDTPELRSQLKGMLVDE
jgi:predicted small metal-binding protein